MEITYKELLRMYAEAIVAYRKAKEKKTTKIVEYRGV